MAIKFSTFFFYYYYFIGLVHRFLWSDWLGQCFSSLSVVRFQKILSCTWVRCSLFELVVPSRDSSNQSANDFILSSLRLVRFEFRSGRCFCKTCTMQLKVYFITFIHINSLCSTIYCHFERSVWSIWLNYFKNSWPKPLITKSSLLTIYWYYYLYIDRVESLITIMSPLDVALSLKYTLVWSI